MSCSHKYCGTCMYQYFESINKRYHSGKPRCGMCRQEINELLFKDYNSAIKFNEKYIVKGRALMIMVGDKMFTNYEEAQEYANR